MSKDIVKRTIDRIPNMDCTIDGSSVPVIEGEDYQQRIEKLFAKDGEEYQHFVFYGDREHFSSIEYFTGYDPRFEESLLILSAGRKPILIVGNEGRGYAEKIPIAIDIIIYPFFSLPGQPMAEYRPLEEILRETGIVDGGYVGVCGWKLFDGINIPDSEQFDVPYFIMEALLKVVSREKIGNANRVMIDNETGLMHNLGAKEMVLAEMAGTKASKSVFNVLKNLAEGLSEIEASTSLSIDGEPEASHPNINFGKNVFYGLASPTYHRHLQNGDLVGAGMSYRRALVHKISYFVKDETCFSDERRAVVDEIFGTYFKAISVWYESVTGGVTGGSVYDKVEAIVGGYTEFGIGLNPGHSIHTQEWTNSLFYSGSKDVLHSGMLLQCDFSSVLPKLDISVHSEDGIMIVNKALQEEIRKIAPDAFERMQCRREFMRNELGINLAEDVLPTSDLSGIIFPYLGNLNTVLANQ